jgi:hypothetical protein
MRSLNAGASSISVVLSRSSVSGMHSERVSSTALCQWPHDATCSVKIGWECQRNLAKSARRNSSRPQEVKTETDVNAGPIKPPLARLIVPHIACTNAPLP